MKLNNTKKNNLLEEFQREYGTSLLSLVLIGSYARGTATTHSDVDILVVVEKLTLSYSQKTELISKHRLSLLKRFFLSFDVILLEKEDVLANIECMSPLFASLALGFDILYDPSRFFKKNVKLLLTRLSEEEFLFGGKEVIWDLQQEAINMLNSPALS